MAAAGKPPLQRRERSEGGDGAGGPTTAESVGVIAFLSLALKLMLLPSSQSSEFDRQGAWLSRTLYKPIAAWYEESAEPGNEAFPLECAPGFALFKAVLARVAWVLDPTLIVEDPTASAATAAGDGNRTFILFQRASVILTEPLMLLGVLLYCTTWPSTTTTDMEWSRNKVVVVVALTLFNPGLILVDHIYLHYTGCAVGLLLISMAFLRRDNDAGDLLGAVALVVVIFFDHTLIPSMVPLYLVYLFRHYCSLPPQPEDDTPFFASASKSGLASDGLASEGHEEDSEDLGETMARALGPRRRRKRSNGPGASPKDDLVEADSDGSYFSRASPASGSRRRGHARAQSEFSGGQRLQAAYEQFKADASFKKLLARPRARSNFEFIAAAARTVSLRRLLALFGVLWISVMSYAVPFHFGGLAPRELLGQLWSRLTAAWALPGGVCRPYWAPNVWALYKGLDRLLYAVNLQYDIFEISDDVNVQCSLEDGGTCAFVVLPEVHPIVCVGLMGIAMYPALKVVWELPHQAVLMPVLVYLMTCSFMLGYHVQEVSVLLIILPLTITSCDSTMDARLYLLMSWIAHMSLLPVLKTTDLKAIKPVLLLLHSFGSFIALDQYHLMARQARRIRVEPNGGGVWLRRPDRLYFVGLAAVYLCTEVLAPIVSFFQHGYDSGGAHVRGDNLLANIDHVLVSVYCALGLVHSWALAYRQVTRKVALIESYQWSPKAPEPLRFGSSGTLPLFDIPPIDLGPRSPGFIG
ncbi:Dolichyl pyrophosphate Glc1Man9GlcNAc2 alpha-1,3-glucosyltransferase [Hondaea fermentalgiana]|uniref:Alpha-1,3-glucosyltransferase n=1 Tax=Hondaea fermentalgiana TaxID=2315210 RepID=A0A2R5GAC6_9STRA|nr:Dolichyl pyrophosphate Glc1Man9GlcNAc2 alpha-1,3-glucosyltransferase [Hondaea fermentalgiana]|eukprot:GBG26698.1 Dolichyl pyrophosphate Glc1Man9GlcNAc2 alpha-1,3-glucosyltransferase [Hondaea fermentalgiana]